MATVSRLWLWGERHQWLLALVLTALVRVPSFTNKPLGPDEPVYATQGLDWSLGGMPLVSSWDNKSPTYLALWWFSCVIAPRAPFVVAHVLVWLAVAGLCYMTGRVCALLADPRSSLPTCLIAVALLNANLSFEHIEPRPSVRDLLTCYSEPFEMLLVVVSLWLLLRRPGRVLSWGVAGAALSVAFQLRQTALLFVSLPIVIEWLGSRRRPQLGYIGAMALGFFAALLPLVAGYGLAGHLHELWFWTMAAPSMMSGSAHISLGTGLRALKMIAAYGSWQCLGLVLAVPFLLLRVRDMPNPKDGAALARTRPPILVWAALGMAATGANGLFFAHYFTQAVPAFAAMAGYGYLLICGQTPASLTNESSSPGRANAVPWLGSAILVGTLIMMLSSLATTQNIRSRESLAENTSDRAAGSYIRSRAQSGDRLYVFGSEPSLYVWSGLKPAAPEIDGLVMTRAAAAGRTAPDRIRPDPKTVGHAIFSDPGLLQDVIGAALEASPPRFVALAPFWGDDVHARFPYIERLTQEHYRRAQTFESIVVLERTD